MRPWVPESLAATPEVLATLEQSASYIVVEEILADVVRTVVSVWPMLDPEGMLRFGDPQHSIEYTDSRSDVQALIEERLVVQITPGGRDIEVGDVYLVMGPVGRGPGGGGRGGGPSPEGDDPGDGGRRLSVAVRYLGEVDIYDVTAQARLAATATYSAATAGVLSRADAAIYFDDGEDDTQGRGGSAPLDPSPGGTGGGSGDPISAPSEASVAQRIRGIAIEVEEPPPEATAEA
jgi:hypothetical protein